MASSLPINLSISLFFSLSISHSPCFSLSLSLPLSFFLYPSLSSSISHSLNSILFISSQLAQPHLSAKLWEPLLDPTEVSIFTHEMYLFVSLIVGWCLLCAIRDNMKVPLYVHSAINIHLTLSHIFYFFYSLPLLSLLLPSLLLLFFLISSRLISSPLLSSPLLYFLLFSSLQLFPLYSSLTITTRWHLVNWRPTRRQEPRPPGQRPPHRPIQ